MRYVIRLERIGDNHIAYLNHYQKMLPSVFGRREIQAFSMGNKSLVPWVAKITGVIGQKLQREFERGQRDYSQTNSVGSRGIYDYYALRDGIYEVNQRVSWKKARRYFIRVVGESAEEISLNEVMECFKK